MAEQQRPIVKSDGTSSGRQIAIAIIRLQQQMEELIKKVNALAPPGP